MLVGQSWTWIQIVSPLLSIKGIAYRFIRHSEVDEELAEANNDNAEDKIIATICANICCVLPMVIFILSIFVYTDERPEWAKQFNVVRFGFAEQEYPPVDPLQ